MPVLNQVTVPDAYSTTQAVLKDVWNARGGWLSVSTFPVFVRLQYSLNPNVSGLGNSELSDEIELGVGAFASIPGNCVGIQFRNAVAGNTATVTCQIAQGPEPALSISALGTIAVSVASITFQHNDVVVATEPVADFEDSGSISWTIADDVINTRVKITPATTFGSVNTGIFVFSDPPSTGPLSVTFSGAQTAGSILDTAGRIVSFAAATATTFLAAGLTTDTVAELLVDHSGLISWGPGGATAIGDVTLSRTAVGVLTCGGTAATTTIGSGSIFSLPQATTGAYITNGGVLNCVVAATTSNTIAIGVANNTDTVSRWIARPDRLEWGPGTSRDTILTRTGVGLLLLTTGVGIGYGTGTGGTSGGNAFGAGVTINKATGTIVYTSGTIVAGATSSTTLTNSTVALTDVVVVTVSLSGTVGSPVSATARITAAGTVIVTIVNNSAGTITASTTNCTVAFAVIKTATA